MWSYIWSVNGKKIETKPQFEFFSKEDAWKDAELHKPLTKKNDKAELEVSNEYKNVLRKQCKCGWFCLKLLNL